MGDHRAHIKVEFSMYGETRKWDTSINWSDYDSEYDRVDDRVVEWFRDAKQEMYNIHMEESWQKERQMQEKQAQEAERREYERLKAKFESLETPKE